MVNQSSLIQAVWTQSRGRIILLALLLLIVLISAAGLRWISEPRLVQLQLEQLRLQQQVRQRQAEFAQRGVPVSSLARIERNLQHFQELVPPQSDFSNFLGELFQWPTTAGLTIDQISYQPALDVESGLLAYGMNFSVAGSYAQLKYFLDLLEASSRLLIVDNISMAQSGKSEIGHLVTLKITLTTYFQGETE